MAKKDEAVYIQIGEERIELTGEAKELLLAEQAKEINDKELLEAEYKAKQDARDSAIKKLGEIAGLTEEEIEAII